MKEPSSSEEEVTENEISDENDAEERGLGKRDRRLARRR